MEKKVIIYTTPTCVYCKMAKEFFKERGVSYEERNVADNDQDRQSMIDKSGQLGVPVIEVEGEIFVGFDKDGLARALGL